LPTTGSINIEYHGTVTVHTGAAFGFLDSPSPGPSLNGIVLPSPDQDVGVDNTLTSGGTFTSNLFDVTITATDAPGTYRGSYTLDQEDSQFNILAKVSVGYSLTLVSSSVVPEPSSAVSAVIGAVAFIAYGWSRHRRAQRHETAA
jgi:hypothetical protein